MTTDELDPLIHVPTRLKIVATVAALPDGDTLSFTRLQDMIGLTPGNLIIHLRKLEEADYISSDRTGNGSASRTTVAHRPRPRSTRQLHPGAAQPARRPVNGPADPGAGSRSPSVSCFCSSPFASSAW
jgi:DNA-binding transcriptional ArsR family regulator